MSAELTFANDYLRHPPRQAFWKKFSTTARNRGVCFAGRVGLANPMWRVTGPLGRSLKQTLWARESRQFDRTYKVRTAGWIAVRNMNVKESLAAAGSDYVGLRPKFIRYLLRDVDLDHRCCTFVDFGSGMGRVLFAAADYPYKKIIGVEFSPELHQIAEANIHSYTNPNQKCFDLTSLCMSADEYALPDGDLVLFFSNPFGPAIMEPVLSNIAAALARSPRNGYILYAKPKSGYLMDRAPYLNKVSEGLLADYWYSIYKFSLPNKMRSAEERSS
jgi:SAM-dependent methyltransferase